MIEQQKGISRVFISLCLPLLLDLELLFAEDGRYLALHEGPGDRRAGQRALLAAGAVHLVAVGRPLRLDALARAREAELVVGHGGALDEVGVLEPLVAEGAFQGGRGGGAVPSAAAATGGGGGRGGGVGFGGRGGPVRSGFLACLVERRRIFNMMLTKQFASSKVTFWCNYIRQCHVLVWDK